MRRPLLEAIETPTERRRAADRRDRPRRRGVRGVPARAALGLPGHDPRDRDDQGASTSRRSCSRRTARASCTTRSSAAACTTGSATRRSSARSRSCGSASPACPSASPRRRPRSCTGCAALDLAKPPGVAETIDWAQALAALGGRSSTPRSSSRRSAPCSSTTRTCSRVRDATLQGLVEEASASGRVPAWPTPSSRKSSTFGRVLREAGARGRPGPPRRTRSRARPVDLSRRDDVYWALRQTLVSRWDDLERSTPPSAPGFSGAAPTVPVLPSGAPETTSLRLLGARRGEAGRTRPDEAERGPAIARLQPRRAPAAARLRGHDARRSSRHVGKLIARSRRPPTAPSRRLRPHHRGRDLDMRRLVRQSLRHGGERDRAHLPQPQCRSRASSSSSATSRARWRRTRGRWCCSCRRSLAPGEASRRSPSARA